MNNVNDVKIQETKIVETNSISEEIVLHIFRFIKKHYKYIGIFIIGFIIGVLI